MKENTKKYLIISASAIISFVLIMKLKKMFSNNYSNVVFPNEVTNNEKEVIKNVIDLLNETENKHNQGTIKHPFYIELFEEFKTFKNKLIKGEYSIILFGDKKSMKRTIACDVGEYAVSFVLDVDVHICRFYPKNKNKPIKVVGIPK